MKKYVVKVQLDEKELKTLGVSPERADFNDAVRDAIKNCISQAKSAKAEPEVVQAV